jgi:LemA protein
MKTTSILLIIVGVIIIWFVYAYNRFVRLITRAKEAWSDIEIQMKRRYDLIPNLVETVKGYAAHEKGVFEEVTAARTSVMNATNQGPAAAAKAENQFEGALKSLFAVAENYPDLKANQNFLQLQNELVDTEDKIQASRRFYNGTVRDFNTAIQKFPGNIFASIFGFSKREFFDIDEKGPEGQPVKVQF